MPLEYICVWQSPVHKASSEITAVQSLNGLFLQVQLEITYLDNSMFKKKECLAAKKWATLKCFLNQVIVRLTLTQWSLNVSPLQVDGWREQCEGTKQMHCKHRATFSSALTHNNITHIKQILGWTREANAGPEFNGAPYWWFCRAVCKACILIAYSWHQGINAINSMWVDFNHKDAV